MPAAAAATTVAKGTKASLNQNQLVTFPGVAMKGVPMASRKTSPAATMKAVRIHSFGGPEVMRLEDMPVPQPQDDEILLRVHAASVNPVDYKTREGKFPAVGRDKLPVTLEFEKAGKVSVSLDVEGVGAQGPAAGGDGMKKMDKSMPGMKM